MPALQAAIELNVLENGLLFLEQVEKSEITFGEAVDGALRRLRGRMRVRRRSGGGPRGRRGVGRQCLREGEVGEKSEREDEEESHELSSYLNHADEKINERTDVGDANDEEKPEDFLRGVGFAGGAVIDHPDPKSDADEGEAAGAFEQSERHENLKGRHFHLEGRDAGEDAFAVLDLAEVGALSEAVGSDEVIARIMELGARGEAGAFADDAVAFDDELGVVGIGDDPLASLDGDDARAVIVDGDMIHKSIWPVRGAFFVRIVFHTIKGDPETG